MKKIITNINNTNNEVINIEEKQKIINKENNLKLQNRMAYFNKRIIDNSTDYVVIDGFIENEEEDPTPYIIYKHWKIEILSRPEVETIIDQLLPCIHYEILYQEDVGNTLNFYNSDKNLFTTDFYEVKDKTLFLHVSTYIEKTFGAPNLIFSNIKLLLSIVPLFKTNN
jgi:hypothetical protein